MGCLAQPQAGGVVYASHNRGAVSITGSNMTGCAAYVRLVELAACSAARQRERDREGRGCLIPALSSQPQNGGVVYAWSSGAVSLIDLTVTTSSAGFVRLVELAARP